MAMVVSSGAMLQDGMPLGTPSAAGAVHDGPAGRTSLGAGTAQGAVLACYALHLTSGMVEFGLASLVAVVLNYTLRCVTQDPLWAGHHTHMIRLFWLGFLGGAGDCPLDRHAGRYCHSAECGVWGLCAGAAGAGGGEGRAWAGRVIG